MSKARNLADLLDSSGDVVSGALDNVPPSNDASALTTGTLPVERVPYVGRRNLIINGAMQVWQRGTSFSSAGYNADRWYLNVSGGTATVSRQSFAVEQEDVPFNPQYYLNLNVTTGNDNCGIHYRHEGTHEFDNKTLTLSFYAKSSNARELTVQFQTIANSATEIVNHTVTSSTFTPTSSWQRYTFELTAADMSGVSAYAGNDCTRIMISQGSDTSTSAWQLDITGVQLEVGTVATPFEHRSYGEELQLCSRYFQRYEGEAQEWIYNEAPNANAKWWQVVFPNGEMRSNPALTFSSGWTGGYVTGLSGTVSSMACSTSPNRASCRVTMSATGGSSYNVHHTDSFTGDYCYMDAEL
jgi:hypothetical protein